MEHIGLNAECSHLNLNRHRLMKLFLTARIHRNVNLLLDAWLLIMPSLVSSYDTVFTMVVFL